MRSKEMRSWSLIPSPLGVMSAGLKERSAKSWSATGRRTTLELLSTWGAASPGVNELPHLRLLAVFEKGIKAGRL